MGYWTKVKPDEARPGDYAFHKDGFDPQKIICFNRDRTHVALDILGAVCGPFPVENYTFRRRSVEVGD